MLLGHIISDKQVNKDAFKSTICSIWRLIGKLIIKEADHNLFIFEFQQTLDLIRVKGGWPWTFDRNLLCLAKFDGKLALNQSVSIKNLCGFRCIMSHWL